MRRAVPIGLAVVALLLLLGAPFLGVRWGFPDDRVLPRSAVGAPGRRPIAQRLRRQLRDRGHHRHSRRHGYHARRPRSDTPPSCRGYPMSPRCPHRRARSSTATGSARRRRPPTRPGQRIPDRRQHRSAVLRPLARPNWIACTRVPGPAGSAVDMTGTAQINRDSVHAITSRLPLVLGLIAVIMFVLLFLLTGSVVMPLKALGAQRVFADRGVRRDGVDIPGRAPGRARHHIDRNAGREHAGAAVLHRVRAVDGLRGVPGVADPGVLAEAGVQRRRHRAGGRQTTTRASLWGWPAPAG